MSHADAVAFVQAEGALADAAVLVQLYEAVRCDLPVLCVSVVGGGYDFGGVAGSLLGLRASLSREGHALVERQAALLGHTAARVRSRGDTVGPATPLARLW